MPKKLITDAFLQSKPAPGEYWDSRISGLCMRVSPAGRRTWSLRYRPKGSTSFRRLSLGLYPELGIKQARERAEAARVDISGGADPAGKITEKKAIEAASKGSFNDLADAYLERYAKAHKKSWAQDDMLLRAHVRPQWGDKASNSITRANAAELLDKIASASPTSANRVQTVLSKLFNWAVDSGTLSGNPVARMKKRAKEKPKDRILTAGEIQILWSALDSGISANIAACLRFLLLSGLRPGEAAGAAMNEIKDIANPAKARLEIPAKRMKGDRPHVVPLAPMALDIIRGQCANAVKGQDYIFASNFYDRGPIARHSLSQAIRRLIDGLESEDESAASLKSNPPTPHDFRRTLATGLAALGVVREDRLAVMAHIQSDIHGKHYDHYDRLKEKRAALSLWESHIKSLIGEADK